MANLREIYQLGSDVIRSVAAKVEDVHDVEIQTLIDDMIFTCKASKGVGIAAPQVNCAQAIVIIASEPSERYPNAPTMEPTALINPKILSHSHKIIKDWEGCLSLPGIRAQVPRYSEVEVLYTDRDGEEHTVIYSDFVARVFQHEFDHLMGKVFIDRVESTYDVVMEKEYQRIIGKTKGEKV
ncbi:MULTISPECIES: peptide deformylase [unclassified Sulfurospirillum]|uniref:peptide deformylase n=1 Tax=unclassified Sulfurospirillum TaxID=2618290 RepID=UPI0005010FC5|nr:MULTISPECIES: peptide deformylase [unclassified Sulfurospirillum]KFL33213.1 peptide deformylase [Sulfurospirillum sp. SCADC]